MFKEVLVPLDGSHHSEKSLEYGAKIANESDAKIILMHVYSIPQILREPSYYPPSDQAVLASAQMASLIEGIRDAGKKILDKAKRQIDKLGIEAEEVLVEGHVVEEILRVAQEKKPDLIVLGAQGHSRIKEIFLGSTTENIVRHAPCPVLVIR